MIYKDEIIEEVWKNRDAYAERCHHDLNEVLEDLKARQKKPLPRMVDRRNREKEPAA